MQSSNAPNKISLPFAASGTKNTIPVPSQQGVTPGAASFTDGFPPLTFTPLSAGGVPPAGADFNGILNAITALQQWKSAGGQFPFDATFATAIGGYPKGATVLKADGTGLWISTAENNTANPDTGGAGWLAFSASSVQASSYNTAPDTGSVNAYAMTLSPAPASLTPGMVVVLQSIKATNTAASALNVNGLGARPIQTPYGDPIVAGVLNAGSDAILMLNAAGTAWTLVNAGNAGVAGGAAANFAAMPQVGGSPIVESGSNANGNYIKWADGTMIVFGSTTGIPLVATAYNIIVVTYPSTFVDTVTVTGLACFLGFNVPVNNGAGIALESVSTTGAHINIISTSSTQANQGAWFAFFGRWK